MKRRTFIKTGVAAGGVCAILKPFQTRATQKKYVFGFSQSNIVDPWRVQFNKDVKKEADKYPEVELIITEGQDRTEKQVADVESLIRWGVDLLLVSPKESAGLTGVVLEAIDKKIPVIMLDRNVNTDKYACFIGGDNVMIARTAGAYAVNLLGGRGAAKGNIVELWNAIGTAQSQDRNKGFSELVSREPGVKSLLQPIDCNWNQGKAYSVMASALQQFDKIDLVYGHNDSVAYGAYLAAKDAGREKEIKFLGIDGLPEFGVTWVARGELTATFTYPIPGAEGIRQGLKLMKGETIERTITLPTQTIDKSVAEQILKGSGLVEGSGLAQTPNDPRVVGLLYATNRLSEKQSTDNLPDFSSGRSKTLTFGAAAIRVPENHVYGNIERNGQKSSLNWSLFTGFTVTMPRKETPETDFVLKGLTNLTKEKFVQLIRDIQTESALVYVHGFNTSFRDVLFQLAQITWDTQYAGIPIAFSWPSKGPIDITNPKEWIPALMNYNYDRESARFSQDAFLDLLHLLKTTANVSKVFVLAHSMGNQIVVNSIDEASYAGEKDLLTEAILAAPDVDSDTFDLSERQLAVLAKGITVYASAADKALRFSVSWNGEDRVGFVPQAGPFTFTGVETIDVTAVGDDMLGSNHQTFSEKRPVLNDIGQILATGKHPPNIRSTEIRAFPEGSRNPLYWRFPK